MMPMKRSTFNISLPPAMAREVDAAMRRERRTRSELVREALRAYLRTYTPTASEKRAIARGRVEISRGDYVTLDQLHAELERLNLKKRVQVTRARTATRTRSTARRA
jgi:metal-responsive CopG/Arc/MetJ family transcriptional regulator